MFELADEATKVLENSVNSRIQKPKIKSDEKTELPQYLCTKAAKNGPHNHKLHQPMGCEKVPKEIL